MSKKIPDNELTVQMKDVPMPILAASERKRIRIADIIDMDSTQIREGYDENAVKEFARIYAVEMNSPNCMAIPAIKVLPVPGKTNRYWLIDGHHRVRAAMSVGMDYIFANVANPTVYKDITSVCKLHFLQARENAAYSANRTNETKRRQIRATITERAYWNNFQIAKYCCVSRQLVDQVREEMLKEADGYKYESPKQKAKKVVADSANEGKSVREIAKENNLSEATVRRARQNAEKQNDADDEDGQTFTLPDGSTKTFEFWVDAEKWAEENDYAIYPMERRLVPTKDADPRKEVLDFQCDDGSSIAFSKIADAEKWAEQFGFTVDVNNMKMIKKSSGDEIAKRLKEVSAKAKDAVKKQKHTIQLTFSDVDNMATIVDEFYNWLGNRRETFWILFGEKMNSEDNK